jgi:hypothetical protein
MRKTLLCLGLLGAFQSNAQNYIDNYLSGTPTYTTVANSAQSINMPRDLDFKPNTHELWVANKGTSAGGSIVIVYDAGQTTQSSQLRKDSHTGHFMIYPTGIAFGDNGEWASVNEIKNTASPTSTFMGPALWSSDTSIFSRVFQNNWVGSKPLGSHLDMLHQSPFAMGVAHDEGNSYWVFDGHNGNLCKYDFDEDHSPGYDDHSNGKIWRYSDILLTRLPDVPGHMVKDKATGWLYIVDAGTQRLIRVNTTTGTQAGTLTVPSSGAENLIGYWNMTGATVEVIETFTGTQPSGVDLYNGRLIVSDYQTGDIYVYDITGTNPVQVGTIATSQTGIMGVKIGTDGKIWFVNYSQNTVVRIDPASVSNDDAAIMKITSPEVNSFPGEFFHNGFSVCGSSITPTVELKNTGANTLTSANINYTIDGGTPTTFSWSGSLASGVSASVTLPNATVTSGIHVLAASVTTANGNPDSNPANDKSVGSFRVRNPNVTLPVLETFTAAVFPPAGWTYTAHNFNNEMSRHATVGGWGVNTGCMRMDNYSGSTDIAGQKDYLVTPRIDFTNATSTVALGFHVAYAQYEASSADQLSVLVSTDCGETWTSIYSQAGSILATAPPTTGPFVPTASQWKMDVVSLAAYAGQSDVMFAFVNTSGFGNDLFLDNINIANTLSVSEADASSELVLYPNPSNGRIFIELSTDPAELITVNTIDIVGKHVKSQILSTTNNKLEIDLSAQASGTYFVEVVTKDKTFRQKVTLTK